MLCGHGFEFTRNELETSPYNALEIGIFDGDSISQLGTLFPDKKIYGVDPFLEDGNTTHITEVEEGQKLNVQKENSYKLNENLKNVKIFEMTSKEFLDGLTPSIIDELNVGHVLIDGSHHYKDVVLDGTLALKLIGAKQGTVIFDDLHIPDVDKAHSKWVKSNKKIIKERIELTPNIIAYRIN